MALSVLIVMGSVSDLEQITPAWKVLESDPEQSRSLHADYSPATSSRHAR